MKLQKIISGGQTGADRAALVLARQCGIATGGTMPKGFIAHDGRHPEFAQLYGMVEHADSRYAPRTAANVKDSDATVRFAGDFNTAGEICTIKAIRSAKKPHFDVPVDTLVISPGDLADWLAQREIATLNVAGNSEQTWPGIHSFTYSFLLETLILLGELTKSTKGTMTKTILKSLTGKTVRDATRLIEDLGWKATAVPETSAIGSAALPNTVFLYHDPQEVVTSWMLGDNCRRDAIPE